MSNILDISLEPFAAGRILGKCVAQCLVTFYYDEPRVTTTVAVIEVPCSVVDDNVALLKHIESLEKTAIDSGLPFMVTCIIRGEEPKPDNAEIPCQAMLLSEPLGLDRPG